MLNAAMKGMKWLAEQARTKKPIEAIRPSRWTILRGDKVEVISGPEKGKQGTVLKVLRDENRVIVEGVNVRRRTQKPSQGQPGKMITYPAALHVSRVHLVDPTTNLPSKVSRRYLEDGTKVRVSRTSNTVIAKPEWKRERPRSSAVGPKDTLPGDVYEVTFDGYVPIMLKK